MRRIAIGATTALAVWLGSAVMAEAQSPTITTTGPLAIYPGPCTTYTADVYLPTPMGYRLRISIMRGSTEVHWSETIIANPGTNYSTAQKTAAFNQSINPGDVLTFNVTIKWNGTWYNASNTWEKTVQGTRPSTKSTLYKSTTLALQSIDRDRRRE